MQLAQALKRFQPVNAGHKQVKKDQIRFQALLHPVERFFACGRSFDVMILHFKQRPDIAQHSRLVIHQQDLGLFCHYFFP